MGGTQSISLNTVSQTSVLYRLRQVVIKSIGPRGAQRNDPIFFCVRDKQIDRLKNIDNCSWSKSVFIVGPYRCGLEKEHNDSAPALATIRMNGESYGATIPPRSRRGDRFPPVLLFRFVRLAVVRTFVNISNADDERRIKWALIIERARAA